MLRRIIATFSRRKFVGKDLSGNSYYEVAGYGSRPRRTMNFAGTFGRASDLSPAGYSTDNIPPQWKAWLSHTRPDPPSIEELEADLQRIKEVKEKARILEEKWAKRKEELMQSQEYRKIAEKVEEENKGSEKYFEESRKPAQPAKGINPEKI